MLREKMPSLKEMEIPEDGVSEQPETGEEALDVTRAIYQDSLNSIPQESQDIIDRILERADSGFGTNPKAWSDTLIRLQAIFDDFKSGLVDDAETELEKLALDV
jgi:hypothetical protein